MSTVDPAAFYTSIFNTEAYKNQSGYLTIDYANRTYLKLVGGSIYGSLAIGIDLSVAGNINLSGSTSHLYLTGASSGIDLTGNASQINLTGNASHIMLTGNSSHLTLSGSSSNIHLTGTNSTLHLPGTGSHIQIDNLEAGNASGSQGAIKCAGGAYFGNQVYVNANLDVQSLTFNGVSFVSSYYISLTAGIAGASQALVLDPSRNIVNINSLSATNLTGTLQTASQPNITSLGNLLGLGITPTTRTVATGQTSTNCIWFSTLDRRYGMRQIDLNNFVMLAYSAGGTYNDYITWQHGNPVSLNINGTINTTGLYLNNSLVNATATELNYLDFSGSYVLGVNEASKAVVLNASRNTSNINNISVNNIGLGNSTDYRSLIDCGNVNAGAGLDRVIGVFNNGTTFSGFGVRDNLLKIQSGGANGIAFYTGSTSSSVGTEQVRISPSTTNIINTLALNGTSITATATELNYVDITTIGTAQASKALVLDASRNIININSITSDFLTINTSISSGNASATFRKLNLNGIITNFGVASIRGGNNNSPYWGSTDSLIWMESQNASPIEAEINVSSLSKTTTTNAFRMGTNTNNDMVLFTNATERMRISSGGNITINGTLMVGTSTDTTRFISALDSSMGTATTKYLSFGRTNDTGNQVELGFNYAGSNSNDNALTLGFFGAERARLTRYGSFIVGTGTQSIFGGFRSMLCLGASGSTEWLGAWRNNSNSNNRCIALYDLNDTEKGGITWGTGTTAFNTSSDYRLKKDIIPITNGLELINNLNPVKFKWKDSNIDAEGFIAHELQQYLPHCVDGEKDGYYENGTIKPQSVDYGKITTTLVSAVKELYDKIKKLENELNKNI